MRRFFYHCCGLKNIVLLSCALSLSVMANAQTATPQTPPAKTTASDDDMDTDSPAGNDSTACVHGKCNENKFIVSADFGGSTIYSTVNSNTTMAPGLTWAAAGQLAHEFRIKSHSTRLFLSWGIELRNFNDTLSSADGVGGTAYDNYHYWYAGIPCMFQVVHVKHQIGHLTDIGYYAQASLALGFKVDMLDVYSIQGNNSWNDVDDNYTAIMLQQNISAGIAIRTTSTTYLVGPYLGSTISNISKVDGLTQNVLSYGARLSILLFK